MKLILAALAFCFAAATHADSVKLRFPGFNCGGEAVGWDVAKDPVDKSIILKCPGPVTIIPVPVVCTGGKVIAPDGVSCVCPVGTVVNAQGTCGEPATGWNGTCAGFDRTIIIDIDWAKPVRAYTGTMGVNDAIVARFRTGFSDSAANNLPRIAGAEWGSPPSGRSAVLSATPCDFGPQATGGAVTAGTSVSVPFAIGLGNNFGYYPILQKNTTYYFNVKNVPNQSCSAQGVCDMFVELLKPSGL